MPSSTAADLIPRLKADPAALNEWLARRLPELTRWLDLRVGVSPGHGGGASDVVQNFACDLLRGIPDSIATEDQLLGWTKARLRHRAIDLSRKQLLVGLSPGPAASSSGAGGGPLARLTNGYSSPTLQVARQEREEAVLAALGGPLDAADGDLGAGLRDTAVVLLRVLDECPLKAIARGHNLDPVAVARRFYATAAPVWDTLDRYPSPDWTPAQADLRRAVARLPQRQRTAVELAHLEPVEYPLFDPAAGAYRPVKGKYSLDEVAQVLGCTAGAAGQLVHRAMDGLKDVLNRA